MNGTDMKKKPVPYEWLDWTEEQRMFYEKYYDWDPLTMARLLNNAVWYSGQLNPEGYVVAKNVPGEWPMELRMMIAEMPLQLYALIRRNVGNKAEEFLKEISRVIYKSAQITAGEYVGELTEVNN